MHFNIHWIHKSLSCGIKHAVGRDFHFFAIHCRFNLICCEHFHHHTSRAHAHSFYLAYFQYVMVLLDILQFEYDFSIMLTVLWKNLFTHSDYVKRLNESSLTKSLHFLLHFNITKKKLLILIDSNTHRALNIIYVCCSTPKTFGLYRVCRHSGRCKLSFLYQRNFKRSLSSNNLNSFCI